MDYLKQIAVYKFWVFFAVAVLLPPIGWWLGTADLAEQIEQRWSELDNAFNSIPDGTNSPNQSWIDEVNKINRQRAERLQRAKQKIWQRQLQVMTWPETVEADMKKCPWHGTLDDPTKQVNIPVLYAQEYPSELRKVWLTVDPVDETVDPLRPSNAPRKVILPSSAIPRAPYEQWENLPPSWDEMWAAQEDIWLIRDLLQAVSRVNESATSILDADIKAVAGILLFGGSWKGQAPATGTAQGATAEFSGEEMEEYGAGGEEEEAGEYGGEYGEEAEEGGALGFGGFGGSAGGTSGFGAIPGFSGVGAGSSGFGAAGFGGAGFGTSGGSSGFGAFGRFGGGPLGAAGFGYGGAEYGEEEYGEESFGEEVEGEYYGAAGASPFATMLGTRRGTAYTPNAARTAPSLSARLPNLTGLAGGIMGILGQEFDPPKSPTDRYIDESEDLPYVTRGFAMTLVMDHRKLPELWAELSQCVFPVRIVRIHQKQLNPDVPTATTARPGQTLPQQNLPGPTAAASATTTGGEDVGSEDAAKALQRLHAISAAALTDPNLAVVWIVGVMTIYKPPGETKAAAEEQEGQPEASPGQIRTTDAGPLAGQQASPPLDLQPSGQTEGVENTSGSSSLSSKAGTAPQTPPGTSGRTGARGSATTPTGPEKASGQTAEGTVSSQSPGNLSQGNDASATSSMFLEPPPQPAGQTQQ